MKEEWKVIDGFPNYEISNKGSVRSLTRMVVGNKGAVYEKKGRIMAVTNNSGWYLSLRLKNSQGYKTCRIHRLVYEHFAGKIREGYEIHHIDGNRQNNCVDNLKMVTKSEHHKLTMEEYPNICNHMIYKNKFGRREIGQFTKDGELVNVFANSKIAQKVTGICSRNICQVVNNTPYRDGRIRQTAGGYKWRYIE